MRIPSLSTFRISIDPSWEYVPVTVWTELELAAGFLCVSLPSIRMLLVTLLPKRVKEFLTNITHPSRSKSNPTPQQAASVEPRKWKKPSSWIDISMDSTNFSDDSGKVTEPLTLGSGVRGSFMSAIWKRSSVQLLQSSHPQSDPRRLESSRRNYGEPGIVVTRPWLQAGSKCSIFEQVEMLNVLDPQSHINASRGRCSGDDGQITALPQIGCIPEGTYSNSNLTREHYSRDTHCSHHGKDMV